MLVRVQFRLICPDQGDAETVRSAIDQKLLTKPLRVTHSAVTVSSVRGQWLVVGDVSFQLRADADDVYADVQAKWDGGQLRNRILAGSTASRHVCTHAEGESDAANCRSIEYQLATKA